VKKFLIGVLVGALLVFPGLVHKYEQTWEIDYLWCGIQTHAAQCAGSTIFY